MFYSVRGDFWGMHRIDLVGTLVSLGLSTLDSVAIKCLLLVKQRARTIVKHILFIGTSTCIK